MRNDENMNTKGMHWIKAMHTPPSITPVMVRRSSTGSHDHGFGREFPGPTPLWHNLVMMREENGKQSEMKTCNDLV